MALLETAMGYVQELRFPLGVIAITLPLYVLYCRKTRKWPDGPLPLPLLGNILAFRGLPPAFVKMADWAKRYGDVMCVKNGLTPIIVLSSIDTVREAFIHKGNEFAGRPKSFLGDVVSDAGKGIVFGDFGPSWKLQRKILHNAFRKYASGSHLEDLIHKSMEGLTNLLRQQKDPFYPLEHITLMINNFILMICCGKHSELDDPEFQTLYHTVQRIEETFANGLPQDYFPPLKYLPDNLFPSLMQIRECMGITDNYFESILREKRKHYNPDNEQDLVDFIIKYEHEAETENAGILRQLTPLHYKHILSDTFFAGTDSSRTVLIWTISLLAAHPDIQKKLQDEIDTEIGPHRLVFLNDKERLPYTNAVFHEVLRFRPPAATAIPHKTLSDISVGGYEIPEGTNVIPNIWALHMDTREWKKPETFKLERWLDKNGAFYSPSRSFLPFSTGRRVCVGESLAKSELVVFIAMIFQRFSFFPASGETIKQEMLNNPFGPMPVPFQVVVKSRT